MGVFISFSQVDQEIATRLAEDFRKHGLGVWSADKDIRPGDLWIEDLTNAIRCTDAFILILSGASIERETITYEFSLALADETNAKRIIPVIVDEALIENPNFIPSAIQDFQWVDLSNQQKYDENLPRLLDALDQPARAVDISPFKNRILSEQIEKLNFEKQTFERVIKVRQHLFNIFIVTVSGITLILSIFGYLFQEKLQNLGANWSFLAGIILTFAIGVGTKQFIDFFSSSPREEFELLLKLKDETIQFLAEENHRIRESELVATEKDSMEVNLK